MPPRRSYFYYTLAVLMLATLVAGFLFGLSTPALLPALFLVAAVALLIASRADAVDFAPPLQPSVTLPAGRAPPSLS